MRKSDRLLAAGIAALVWLVAGYAVATRSVAPRATAPTALETQSHGGSGFRTAFL